MTLDLIYAQDVGLAHYGAVRLNEYYVSQYLDHAPGGFRAQFDGAGDHVRPLLAQRRKGRRRDIFVHAQEQIYPRALDEIRRGRKRS